MLVLVLCCVAACLPLVMVVFAMVLLVLCCLPASLLPVVVVVVVVAEVHLTWNMM